ncbi:lysosomal Pro-X carboxypeptidase [Eurytemora carolleeae]|uniref:lysosomal Pro-X carboxypeptidase n=1 Tax=Eurytemora carolleeae TaxID=1294199 RepID=UPI000C75F72F|nr:lysosomal Pro-X carboxypeptidase [Eurytemora carolleeae]|eukprot:XP_023323387.1 lysosomal Pro-X carboxypeptidase-like [Eurytemora affinis]
MNNTWWVPGGPIFFYTGNEGVIEAFAENSGFMWDIAPEFNALLIFAEHRYYGESLPFNGNYSKDPHKLGYLSSEEALADFAELISFLKATIPGADKSPVIAFGGSYGGMLAAWFRMKYPNICAGAIAASAPVAQFTSPCDAFGRIVTSDFTAAAPNGTCSQTIRSSWAALDRVADKANNTGLDWLNSKWKLCTPLTSKSNMTGLKDYLSNLWTNLAMMDYPYPTTFLAPLPGNPVNAACSKMLGNYSTDEELLSHIYSGVSVYSNYTGQSTCLNIAEEDNIGADMWYYQACSEMVMPFCYDGVNDMFESKGWDLEQFSKDCKETWGVEPRPNMANLIYGGRDVSSASNIIFSNGLLDPWSSGSILKSYGSIVSIKIPEGAHHLDLRGSNPLDPVSVVSARKMERKYIRKWIKQSNAVEKSRRYNFNKS